MEHTVIPILKFWQKINQLYPFMDDINMWKMSLVWIFYKDFRNPLCSDGESLHDLYKNKWKYT